MAVNLIECGYACTYRICTYFVGRRVSLQKLCVPADECQVHVCEKLKVLDRHARNLVPEVRCDAHGSQMRADDRRACMRE